mgnify:CR=1 FL=1
MGLVLYPFFCYSQRSGLCKKYLAMRSRLNSMIIILKRNDLPLEYCDHAIEALQLDHSGLTPELIKCAELIVFVEGDRVKFLKHFPEIQSKDSIDVLQQYIMSIPPVDKESVRFSKKRIVRRKKPQ